jgi:hypothetical protein
MEGTFSQHKNVLGLRIGLGIVPSSLHLQILKIVVSNFQIEVDMQRLWIIS